MKKLFLTPALAVALTSLIGVDSMARPNVPDPNSPGNNVGGSSLGRFRSVCVAGTSKAELDINNVRAMVLNGGDMWWDLTDPRYEVPKVEDPSAIKKHSLFAGAVWIGGRDENNNLHLAAQTYRQGNPADAGFWPGPLDANGQIADATCGAFDFHAKIDRSVVRDFQQLANSATFPIPEDNIPLDIKNWPGKGNPFRTGISFMGAGQLAPFVDRVGDGIYDPRDGDYPKIKGDQSIWWVMNDAGGIKQPVSPTIGLELQVQAFAFQTADLVNNMTFYEQTLINRGSKVLNNTYLAQWVDPDLGNYLDDYVGCDVARGLGFVYNGDDVDEGVSGYGANPPALGVDFFSGPRSDANDGLDNDRNGMIDDMVTVVDCESGEESLLTEEIIMSNFQYYNNDNSSTWGNPQLDTDFYNYMRSFWRNGTTVYYGGDATDPLPGFASQYKFMFPGDSDPKGYGFHQPVAHTPDQPVTYVNNPMPDFAWTERQAGNLPADRRFLQSAGPFTLTPGQVLPLTIGVAWVSANTGGAEGSLALLKVADDAAQQLFNNCFELPKGPNAPDLSITELDQELIISLIPDKYNLDGRDITTEDYVELERTLATNDDVEDPYYRFQGYVVYQLKNPNVSVTDLNNPDLARIVQAENGYGQSDLRDNLTLLTNREFNPTLGEYVSVPKIVGENQGIRHSLRIQRDMFAQGESRLANNKAYHYMAIAYASNTTSATDSVEPFIQYRQGVENVRVYTAYPHKISPEGVVLNATAGQSLPATRIFGVGNGGNVLELEEGEEEAIFANNTKDELKYVAGGSPVNITVYDPKRVAKADFNLKLSSRLTFDANVTNGISFNSDNELVGLSVGDTIYAGAIPAVPAPSILSNFAQIPGIAVINRIVSTESFGDPLGRRIVVLDLQMLNDEIGGTFEAEIDEYVYTPGDDPQNPVRTHDDYSVIPLTFRKADNSVTGTTVDYALHDFWRLNITPEGQPMTTVYSDRTLTDFNEQLLPDYGLAIQLKAARNPGYRVQFERANQIQPGGSSITFSAGTGWLTPLATPKSWLTENTALYDRVDPDKRFTEVLASTWAPYEIANTYVLGGPRYHFDVPNERFDNLPNVNIVMTSDKSKWTRVVVLQAEIFAGCPGMDSTATNTPVGGQRLLKSTVPSVDKDGKPTGEISPDPTEANGPQPSTGLGWFPGYAVDIDRGVRLNLMFSESRFTKNGQRRPNGNDLMWDPSSDADGGKSAIYIMNSVYDEGKQTEKMFDMLMDSSAYVSTAAAGTPQFGCLTRNPNAFATAVAANVFRNVNWVGNMRLEEGATKLETDARVQLRVNRQYRSYNTQGITAAVNDNPEYAFNTFGVATGTNNTAVSSSALDLIRVVPNPYYAYSDYEQRVTDNTVKITNLPARATISIFNMNGTLVQTLRKEDPNSTFVEWNLKNRENLTVASGVYIIHVKAQLRDANGGTTEEEKVVKFFAILRPIDLQSF